MRMNSTTCMSVFPQHTVASSAKYLQVFMRDLSVLNKSKGLLEFIFFPAFSEKY